MNEKDFLWIPCCDKLPDENKDCLVTLREWDIFNGEWGEKEIRIMSYSKKDGWNTKSDIVIEAWVYLPKPYGDD